MTPADLDAFWATWGAAWEGPGVSLLADDDREYMRHDEPLSVAEESGRADQYERWLGL